MNILLTRDDLNRLLKGEVIEKNGIKIALSDIGYDVISEDLSKIYMNFMNKN